MADNLVSATPALRVRKKCSKVRGTTGPRRARLIKEIAKEKKKSTSKNGFVDAPVPPQPDTVPSGSTRATSSPPSALFVVPSPDLPSSSDDEGPPAEPPGPRAATRRTSARSTASRSASQPIAPPSDKEVYLTSDSHLPLLTTGPGRPAVPLRSLSNLDAGSAPLPPVTGGAYACMCMYVCVCMLSYGNLNTCIYIQYTKYMQNMQ